MLLVLILPMLAALDGDANAWWPGAVPEVGRDIESLDRNRRLRAVLDLAAHRGPDATALLLEALRDLDPDVRGEAARVLAARGDPSALGTIEAWVARGTTVDRGLGLEALRLRPVLTDAGRTAVLRALGDSEVNIRLAALGALAGEAGRAAGGLAPRVALLLEDPAPAVRLAAVRLLADSGDRRAVLPLLARLEDPDRQVQRQAAVALGRLGDRRGAGALLRLLEEGPVELRTVAIDALAALRPAEAVPALVRLAGQRPVDASARRAQRALGEIGSPPALEALLALVDGTAAAPELEEALARHAAALERPLLAALEPGDNRASVAALVLGRARRRAAGPALRRLVARADPATPAALRALGALGDRPATETLVEAAALPSPLLRRLALQALLAIGDPRAAVVLPDRAGDGDAAVRLLALQLALQLGRQDRAAVPLARPGWLLDRLRDPAPAVRRQAVATVLGLRPPGALPALLAARPHLVGLEADLGRALVALATPDHLPALIRLAAASSAPARLLGLQAMAPALDGRRMAGQRAPAAAIAALAAALERGGTEAELAAESLAAAGARAASGRTALAAVERAWRRGTPELRARLCAIVTGAPGPGDELAGRLLDVNEAAEVQAAAAWALAGARDQAARAALTAAQRSGHPAVAANARAALAAAAPPDGQAAPVVVRLERPGGAVETGRPWVQIHDGDQQVWVRAGSLGQLRLARSARSAAPVEILVAGPDQVVQHAGHGVGQITGHQAAAAHPPAGDRRGLAVGVHPGHRGVGGR